MGSQRVRHSEHTHTHKHTHTHDLFSKATTDGTAASLRLPPS